ncbi:hypothetical protein ACFFHH_20270 [Cytobacillus solani]|uniref:hypothetical protein n=1 Tax=Cytobacillus solani TaxID=1637975 RepID=UPI0011508ABF|nr:hypothetical protein [Cytobacillus solani]
MVALKYENEKEIEVFIESTDFKDLSFLMTIDHITEVGNAELPEIFLSGPSINPDEFKDFKIVNWDTPIDEFPRLKKEVTIEEVRAVEMPSREVEITAELPIDLAEWLEWNKHDDDLLKEFLYMYKTKASK